MLTIASSMKLELVELDPLVVELDPLVELEQLVLLAQLPLEEPLEPATTGGLTCMEELELVELEQLGPLDPELVLLAQLPLEEPLEPATIGC